MNKMGVWGVLKISDLRMQIGKKSLIIVVLIAVIIGRISTPSESYELRMLLDISPLFDIRVGLTLIVHRQSFQSNNYQYM